jgi:hypothetical protein
LSDKKQAGLVQLSESSGIKLAKTGKTAGLQRSKTLDISSRNRKPGKVGNNGIQEVVGSIPIGSTMILNGLRLTDLPVPSQL